MSFHKSLRLNDHECASPIEKTRQYDHRQSRGRCDPPRPDFRSVKNASCLRRNKFSAINAARGHASNLSSPSNLDFTTAQVRLVSEDRV